MSIPSVLLAVDSLFPGGGGISRVARLMHRVLTEYENEGRCQLGILVYNDNSAHVDSLSPVYLARGSRLKYAAKVWESSFRHSHFIYDFLGMARSHCVLPVLRRPFLAYLHGIEIWDTTRSDRVLAARRASMLLANSEFTINKADRIHGDFSHANVCWLATESDDHPDLQIGKSPGPPTVLILGRMVKGRDKGHDALIACWDDVISQVPEARLCIVGSGPYQEELKYKASQVKASGNIEFKGFVPDELMHDIWLQTDVLAMPSRTEGFGLVYIEAMRHGIPVLGSIHDAAAEVNLDGKTGYNIDLNIYNDLPRHLIEILSDENLLLRMGRYAQKRWEEYFRFSAFRKRFSHFLDQFLFN